MLDMGREKPQRGTLPPLKGPKESHPVPVLYFTPKPTTFVPHTSRAFPLPGPLLQLWSGEFFLTSASQPLSVTPLLAFSDPALLK